MKSLPKERTSELLGILQKRFEKNIERHKGIQWAEVLAKLEANPQKLAVIEQMEITAGEPDVVGIDKKTGEIIFFDCAPESPKERRSLCYDDMALESRKEHKPRGSAIGFAEEMGVQILDEEQYRFLQTLGAFDAKTSSWVLTPEAIRKKGGAIFCDFRFGHVFTYHNGAESYYAARGFRASLKV